jgi:hypothetical protein
MPGYRPFMGPYPGSSFTLTKVAYDGQRLQFDVATNELWKHWCELQTSIPDESNPGRYSCVHNWGYLTRGPGDCLQMDPTTQITTPVDCGKLALCQPNGPCACNAQACTANLDGDLLHFDMVIAQPKADGSVSGLDANLHSVHLNRQ